MDEKANTGRKKVLIAEDEQDLREALCTAIGAEGIEVLAADNGEQALATALEEHPDLLVLDLMMPKMGGREVLKKLREDAWGKLLPVIVLTAQSDMETVSNVIESGGLEYLVKNDWKLEDIAVRVRARLLE
jgi:DNA-binding response OmpR family regulator